MDMLLRFSSNPGIVNFFRRLITGSWADTVELVLPNGFVLTSSPPDGVRVRPLSRASYKEKFYTVPSISSKEASFVRSEAYEWLGSKYDYKAVVGRLLRVRNWQAQGRWTGPELIAWCLYAVEGKDIINPELKNRYWVTTADLLSSPKIVEVLPPIYLPPLARERKNDDE